MREAEWEGSTETTIEQDALEILDGVSRLRYLAARRGTPVELRMEVEILENSWESSSGRQKTGIEWMAIWIAVGANRKGSQGLSATGKDWLTFLVMDSK